MWNDQSANARGESVDTLQHRCSGRDDAGAAMVEFAIILPVFIALVVGILRFGLAIHTQLELSTAAQEGARAAYLNRTLSDVTTAVVNAGAAVGVTAGEVSPQTCTAASSGSYATVTVSRPTAFDWVLGSTNITLSGRGVVRCP